MVIFLMILILIIAVLLILAVMVQSSKKEGLDNSYLGGSMGASQLIGVQKTTDLLEQITWGLVISLLVLTLATSWLLNATNHAKASATSPNIQRAQTYDALPTPRSDNTLPPTTSSRAE